MINSLVRKEYFTTLDILRFLAFFCVFISHTFVFSDFYVSNKYIQFVITYFLTQGNLGVTFFFVLSGFLITYLLLGEYEAKKTVEVSKFYMRRVLRIWPVYFLVVLVGFFLIPFVLHNLVSFGVPLEKVNVILQGTELYRLTWYVFFVANFDMVYNGAAAFFLAILWSISVEEQFYLVWPWVMRKKVLDNFIYVALVLMCISGLYRYINIDDLNTLRASSFSFISDLITGALMAYVVYTKSQVKEYFSRAKNNTLYILTLSVPLAFFVFKYVELKSFETHSIFFNVLYALLPQVLAIQFAVIIAYAAFSYVPYVSSYVGKKLVYLGQISYGLYCYHCLGILFVKGLFMLSLFSPYKSTVLGFATGAVISFAITILLAHLSYLYMEKPILRLKKKYV